MLIDGRAGTLKAPSIDAPSRMPDKDEEVPYEQGAKKAEPLDEEERPSPRASGVSEEELDQDERGPGEVPRRREAS
jgi:hypothetical protein